MLHVHAVTISLFTVHTASTPWYNKAFILLIKIPPTLVDIYIYIPYVEKNAILVHRMQDRYTL